MPPLIDIACVPVSVFCINDDVKNQETLSNLALLTTNKATKKGAIDTRHPVFSLWFVRGAILVLWSVLGKCKKFQN